MDPKVRAKNPDAEPGPTRAERRQRDGLEEELPPIDGGVYLVHYMWEVGPSRQTGMGSVPVCFGELLAWQQQMGIALQPWEVRALRLMAVAYLNESQRATDPGRVAPWSSEPDVDSRKVVGRLIHNVLRD